jgi:hypothetical protein
MTGLCTYIYMYSETNIRFCQGPEKETMDPGKQ